MTLRLFDKVDIHVPSGWVKGVISGITKGYNGRIFYKVVCAGHTAPYKIPAGSFDIRKRQTAWRDKHKFDTSRQAFLVGSKDFRTINEALRLCYKILDGSFRRVWITANITSGPCIMEITKPLVSSTIPPFRKVLGLENRNIYLRQSWDCFD